MIAKIVKGQTFRGVVNYVLNPDKHAELLDSKDVRTGNAQSIIESFKIQTDLNTRVKRPVCHISLDFSARDREKLSNEKMTEIAEAYIQRMGIEDTQFILVRHYDKEHPHVHLVFNRINNNGKTISDRNDRYRSEKICKDLTFQFSLFFAPGKERVNIHRLREPEKTKYQIYEALKTSISDSKNWDDLIESLKDDYITVEFKFKGKTSEVQGVTFTMNGYSFSGSKVDRRFSFSKITVRLEMNQRHEEIKVFQQPTNYELERSVLGNYLGSLMRNIDRQSEWERRRNQKATKPKIKRSKGLKR